MSTQPLSMNTCPTCLTRRNPWYKTCPRSSSWYFSCAQSQNTEPNNLLKQVHIYSTKHFICIIFVFAINNSNGIHSHSFRSIVTSFPHISRAPNTFIRCDFSPCPSNIDGCAGCWSETHLGAAEDRVVQKGPHEPNQHPWNLQAAERRSASTADASWCLAAS